MLNMLYLQIEQICHDFCSRGFEISEERLEDECQLAEQSDITAIRLN